MKDIEIEVKSDVNETVYGLAAKCPFCSGNFDYWQVSHCPMDELKSIVDDFKVKCQRDIMDKCKELEILEAEDG